VDVEVLRDGRQRTVPVTVAKLADDAEGAPPIEPADRLRHGLVLRDVDPAERRRLGLDGSRGVAVAAVTRGSPAEEAGVRAGDVLLEVDRTPVASAEAVRRLATRAGDGRPLLLLLRAADGTSRFAALRSATG
jgi:serine protease Do